MKKQTLFIMTLLLLSTGVFAKKFKPAKTFDHEAFIKKVKISFHETVISKWMPNDKALEYIAKKTGKSLDELKKANAVNTENIKANMRYFTENGIAFVLTKTEVKVTQARCKCRCRSNCLC